MGGRVEPSVWHALPYFLPLAVFPPVIIAAMHGSWWIAGPFIYFLAANSFGIEPRNLDLGKTRENQLFPYKLACWLWAILWPITFVFVFSQIFVAGHLDTWEVLLMWVILAGTAQTVFTVGHELIHRRRPWERCLGEFLLASVSCPHHATEHVYIHHPLVCTPMDAGSAPKGLGFWRYLFRNGVSSLVESWRVEHKRLARRRLPAWHYSNPFWRYLAETVAWYVLIYLMGGPWAVLAFIILCICVIVPMRIGNYVQHYGLQRIRLPGGRYEEVQPRHVWSTGYRPGNWFGFNIQRHADHHAHANRRYPVLQHHGEDASPELPGSYAKLCGLALSPRRWFQVMDPLVDRWRERFYPQIDDWRIYDSPAFFARPEAFEAIANILDTSRFCAGWINREPKLLDTLHHREFTDLDLPAGFGPDPQSEAIARRGLARLYWTRELGVSEMREQLIDFFPSRHSREAAEVAREWSNEKVFQIVMHVIRGNLTPVEAGVALSNVAETSITTALSAVEEDYCDWHPVIAGGGIGIFPPTVIQPMPATNAEGGVTVVVLGELSGSEAAPGSELHLLCVYEGSSSTHYETLCRHILQALHTLSRDNLLLAGNLVGRKHRSVFSLGEFREYYRKEEHAAELLKLTRARCISTHDDIGIGKRFDEARREVLASGAAHEALIRQLEEPGNPVEPGLLDIRNMRGGLRDIDRAVRRLQLVHLRERPDMLAVETTSVLQAASTGGIIPDNIAEQLSGAMKLWRNLEGILNLVGKEEFTVETATAETRAAILQSCEAEDIDSLITLVRDTAARTAQTLDGIS